MMINEHQVELLRNFVKKKLSSNPKTQGMEIDIDGVFLDHVDTTLTYKENKNILREKLKELDMSLAELVTKKEVNEQEERHNKEQLELEEEKYKEELEQNLETIKKNFVDISEFYGDLKDKMEMVKQNYIHSLFLIGDSGCGKTTFVTQQLNGNMVKITGHVSPYKLYIMLHENKDGKIIYFDDVESLLQNEDSRVLIKQATDTVDKRIIMWNTSKDLRDTPDWFILNSNVIFALNSIPSKDESMKAIINRAEKVELNFNWEDYIKIMMAIAKKQRGINGKVITSKERLEIVNFIKDNSSPATSNFSLRTQYKIENYYVYFGDRWKEITLELLDKKDDTMKIVESLIKSGKDVETQIKEFKRLTEKSRATYFNYKKKFKCID